MHRATMVLSSILLALMVAGAARLTVVLCTADTTAIRRLKTAHLLIALPVEVMAATVATATLATKAEEVVAGNGPTHKKRNTPTVGGTAGNMATNLILPSTTIRTTHIWIRTTDIVVMAVLSTAKTILLRSL